MKTDALFYRLFQALPGLVFELAGWRVRGGRRDGGGTGVGGGAQEGERNKAAK